MLTNTGSTGIVKMLLIKKVGLVFASLWVVILVAAVAAPSTGSSTALPLGQ